MPALVFAEDEPIVADVVMPRLEVIGTPERLEHIPGSGQILSKEELEQSRVFTVNEALRKVPGIHVRDEEGFGLRPNIGIRGLNPTRSTKVTLLEDGIPLVYAPYGDNASYFHPSIERFERIEVLKGAGQNIFGPQTIGGVINYITPTPPREFAGSIAATGGNRDYFNGKLQLGGNNMLLDITRKQGHGARDNTDHEINDLNFKAVIDLGGHQALTLRASYFTEDSTVTYTGLTEAEYRNFGPRYNPFKNDKFETERTGLSTTHQVQLAEEALLTTNLYYSYFGRDWWRQSSTTTDTQGGAAGIAFRDARLAGNRVNPDLLNSNQGRLRNYHTWGIEPRLTLEHGAFGVKNELTAGLKAHFEEQKRKQKNGTSPTGRDGTLVEDNVRQTKAYSGFIQNRFLFGNWTLTPNLRYEFIDSTRTNRLPGGVKGTDTFDKWMPGLGGTYNPLKKLTIFAGVHQGFAPPRTEDIIGLAGTSTDVGPEESTNWELGLRAEPFTGASLDATLFRNDFSRQIAVGSIAGGATPLAEGETRYQGLEFSGRLGFADGWFVRGAYTYLPTAEQTTAFKQVVGGATVTGSAAGKRLPYAPKQQLTAALGYAKGALEAQLEAVYVGEQFSDFANTDTAAANGQFGKITDYTIWNAALNYKLDKKGLTLFVTVKNLADKTYIVDRTRGILPGSPRLVQVGLKYNF
jgi:Fe(3+) dicitrate transport protein